MVPVQKCARAASVRSTYLGQEAVTSGYICTSLHTTEQQSTIWLCCTHRLFLELLVPRPVVFEVDLRHCRSYCTIFRFRCRLRASWLCSSRRCSLRARRCSFFTQALEPLAALRRRLVHAIPFAWLLYFCLWGGGPLGLRRCARVNPQRMRSLRLLAADLSTRDEQ